MKLLKVGFIIFSVILAFNGLLQMISYIANQGALGSVIAPLVLLIIMTVLAFIILDHFNVEGSEE